MSTQTPAAAPRDWPDGERRCITQAIIDELDRSIPALYCTIEVARSHFAEQHSPAALLIALDLHHQFRHLYHT
ncbi:MAG: hypothetical protein ABI876_15780, partial [Bacteroidota bacterium]